MSPRTHRMASSPAPAPAPVPVPVEPLLAESQRLTVFPIVHQDIWSMYKLQIASFWTANEVDFSRDRADWQDRLNEDERRFVKHILAFFAGSDSVVMLNLMENFTKDVQVLEAQIAYTFQAAMENVHGEVYSLMIENFITDPVEKATMFARLGDIPSVRQKVAWASRWGLGKQAAAAAAAGDGERAPFARRLVAFAVVEGLFFSGAFCAIYWLKQRNLLPGLTKSNEFIARDEGLHTDFACLLYSKIVHTRLEESECHELFRGAVKIEKEFINESIPCRLVGMNADLMAQYVESVADSLLVKLGYSKLYGTRNPFAFMDLIGMVGRSNFFEERVSLYQRADVLADSAVGDGPLYDEDF